MTETRRVALVSDDLLFQSQLAAAVRHCGAELLVTGLDGALDQARQAESVFVDLNTASGRRLGLIALLREAEPSLPIVGFCHHGEKEVRQAAMHAGASSCITNGALREVAVRLAGRDAARGEPDAG